LSLKGDINIVFLALKANKEDAFTQLHPHWHCIPLNKSLNIACQLQANEDYRSLKKKKKKSPF